MKTWKILTLIAVMTASHGRAGTTTKIIIRDGTAKAWNGSAWQRNPINNPQLAFQSTFVPFVNRGPGTIKNPWPDSGIEITFEVYIKSGAPDQTLCTLKPTTKSPATAIIKLKQNQLELKLLPNTDEGWLDGSRTIKLYTPIQRNAWTVKTLLLVPYSEQQTIGWDGIVNNPIAVKQFYGQSRMIRQPQEGQWTLESVTVDKLNKAYIGEIKLDQNISQNRQINLNIWKTP